MSQSHIRKPMQQPPQPIVWWQLALGFAIPLVLFATLFVFVNWLHSIASTYTTATAKILEIRKVVDTIRDTRYGGKIIYGVEVHAQYMLDGQMQDRWLRASDDLPRESLALKLAAHPTKCLVYWPSNHPDNAKCSLK
jgi:hypothetical protein